MDMDNEPFFSIITPCCDVAPFLRASLDSIRNQDFTDWECILGVETSKDDSLEIAREYEKADPRFRVFTGERSGSCSATRNTGLDMARGKYVMFVDGDDTIAEGSLKRIHDKIAAHPGCDLYPCAIRVFNKSTDKEEPLRDNYPADFSEELTGPKATVMLEKLNYYPCPMLQMTVSSRKFLTDNGLKCIYGLRQQDSEFTTRALYLAKRVFPIHEPFYNYLIHTASVTGARGSMGRFHKDFAVILGSIFAFHAKVSREPGFDRAVAQSWAKTWISTLFIKWFSRDYVRNVPRAERLETLEKMFAGGFGDFDLLLAAGSRAKRLAGWWAKAFVRHPSLRRAAELFFIYVYFPLAEGKNGRRPCSR